MAGTSYTRQSTFVDGDTITASLFNDEYNQLVNAFAYATTGTTGHRHDGNAGEGGNIYVIGDQDFKNKIEVDSTNNRWGVYVEVSTVAVEQIRIQDGAIVPVTDNDIDLGTSSLEFKNLYIDGTAKIDTLTVDEAATIGTTLAVTGATTLSSTLAVTGASTFNGNVTIGDAATDTVTIAADVASNLIPSVDSTYALGDSSNYWSNAYIDAVTTTGNVSVGGNLTVTGNATISGTLTFGDADTDSITLNAEIASDVIPDVDGTYDLGSATKEWQDLYIDGTANIDSLVADTADINSGTIDNTVIGGTTAVAGTFTTATATTGDITTVNSTTVNATTVDSTNVEVTNIKAKDGTASASIADSTGVMTVASAVLTTADINGGSIDNVTIGDTTASTGAFTTLTASGATTLNGNVTLGDAATDNVVFNADVNSSIIPNTDDTYDLGSVSQEWRNLYIDGTANIDSLVADTADINGGTIDNATIATSNITVGTGKTLDVSSGTLTLADNQISGNKVEGGTIAAITITDLTFGNLNDGTITIANFIDDDTFGTASATTLPTSESVKAYVDAQVTAQDLDFQGDSGGALSIDLDSETLTIAGGTGIDTSGATNTLTVSIDSTVATLTGTQTLTNKTLTSPVINTGVSGTAVLDDDTFATASSTTLATSESIKAYVDTTVAATNEVVEDTTPQLGGDLDTNGNDILFADNDKAIFGAGSDLQIYHDGSNSYISDQGTGSLKINTNSFEVNNVNDTVNMISGNPSGAVTLHFQNSQKIATTSTGMDVTGTATMDGLTVDGNIRISGTSQSISFYETDLADTNTSISHQTRRLRIATVNDAGGDFTQRFELKHGTGDISFFDDTGTSEALYWDASAESLGIGTTSPAVTLDIGSATDAVHVPVGTTAQRPTASAGMFRYNTTLSQFEGYTTEWGAIGGGGTNTFTRDAFTGDGSTTAFTLSQAIDDENDLLVFNGGVFQNQDAYTVSGTTLTFDTAPANGNTLIVYSVKAAVSGNNLNQDSFSGDGTTTAFTLSINPVNENNTQVFIDGVYQQKDAYSTSGTTLTFTAAPPNGTTIEVMTFTQTEINVPVDGTITPAKIASGDFYFDTDTLYIDATNNRVGIGTTSPSSELHVSAANDSGVRIDAEGNNVALMLTDETTSNGFRINYNAPNDILAFDTTNGTGTKVAERMRIDSSGNLLVGTTSVNPGLGNTNEGHSLNASGAAIHSADGNNALRVNRNTSDGTVITIAKDGSTVGSIGAATGTTYIDGGSTFAGLQFGGDGGSEGRVVPRRNGSLVDGQTTLGTSSYRFKDLYLSGGVYVGGTGSANYLDDYEEGTWTGVFTDGTNNATMLGGYSTGTYTKVGNMVTVTGYFYSSSLGSVSGDMSISGLPFANGSLNRNSASVSVGYGVSLNLTAGQVIVGGIGAGNSSISLNLWDSTGGTTPLQSTEFSSSAGIYISATYMIS